MPAGVHRQSASARAGSNPALDPGNGIQQLSPTLVASSIRPAANAGGTTNDLTVPGSIPGCAPRGTVAQMVEHRTPFAEVVSPLLVAACLWVAEVGQAVPPAMVELRSTGQAEAYPT